MTELKKILLLRFSSLGDIVMATPLVRAVRKRFPFAQIDMAVRSDFLDLIRDNPHLDQKIALARGEGMGGLKRLLKRLNRERYDLVYDAHRSLRTLFLMPLLDAEHKAYFRKHYLRRDLALTFKLPFYRESSRMLERYIEPLIPYGVSYDGLGPEVFISDETRARALQKVPLPPSEPGAKRIGLIPSAQWAGKRWPADKFREVAERLVKETPHRLVMFGGKGDTFCADIIRDLPKDRIVDAQGKLALGESAALVAQCDFVIANDTGLMHVADALGIPSVLILGPTSKEMGCLPFHPAAKILEHDLWCRPCSKNGQAPCIRRKRFCLELTSPSDVFGAAMEI